ncbi:hypothetical protein ASD50_13810 [Mesorhizobium sp. Root552]|uniref:helix-turn-helix transcriptional regulator n=1 Tax=Mesorhizobium sp. Root552 TaxID=1736555 RepID=UPI0006FCDCF7|nr:helix-turn-helix transcriptional regulator [Mesorhizobium sp. Root552]KQZ32162.1 hypothetical protein ASD50_13810 [Mesorhizobium sp. Root552]
MNQEKNSAVDFITAEENALMDFQFAILDELEARAWTQARLAEELGVTRARVSQMLSSEANPTLKLAARALTVLGLKAEYDRAERQKGKLSARLILDDFDAALSRFVDNIQATSYVRLSKSQYAANENFTETFSQAA